MLIYARKHQDWTEYTYAQGIYPKLARGISYLTSKVSFSVVEILLVSGVMAGLVLLICWTIQIVRNPNSRWAMLKDDGLTILFIAAICYIFFVFFSGMNYNRLTFSEQSGLEIEPTDIEELTEVSLYLINQCNEYRLSCPVNAEGVVFLDKDNMAEYCEKARNAVYSLGHEYGSNLFAAQQYAKPKALYLSRLMSYTNTLGVFAGFTMEANINVDPGNYEILSTMCHELSHVSGFMREDEANFLSYRACILSGDAEFAYSGSMLAMIHTTNALYKVDKEKYREIMQQLDDGVWKDLTASRTYWETFKGKISKISTSANDAYLKANQQTDGVQSYGRMVDLIIAQYKKDQI